MNLHRNERVDRPAIYRGTYYYPTYEVARTVLQNLLDSSSTSQALNMRLVEYQRGWAIQREKSGPYFGPTGWK